MYHKEGKKLLVSAFGNSEHPTSQGFNPLTVADKLAKFVIANNFDGVNVKYMDIPALQAGTATTWLITFFTQLRNLLPNHTIVVSLRPCFTTDEYAGAGFRRVNKEAGSMIDFYNVEYYNEGTTVYDSYDRVFISVGGEHPGTAMKDLIANGFESKKLVVGKTVSSTDLYNKGWVDPVELGQWAGRAFDELGWFAGVSLWEYAEDKNETKICSAAQNLVNKFKATQV